MTPPPLRIREARSHRDLDEVCLIQREVWNIEDIEIVGRIQLMAVQHAGGSVLIGETAEGSIGGFAYALVAWAGGEAFWHSDMLAVRPAFRGRGLGRALKWAQRDRAMGCGLGRITWTFDPMQAENAHLNLEVLGARAVEYLPDFYGATTSSLHHGLPTDRLLASWDLRAPGVVARARGERPREPDALERVSIPSTWMQKVRQDPAGARVEQQAIGSALKAAFGRGLTVTGFDKSTGSYLLAASRKQ